MHTHRTSSTLAMMAVISLAVTGPLTAQSTNASDLSLGLSVGPFADYPSQFSPRFCKQGAGGATGKVSYWATAFFALEASATVATARGDMECFFPLSPAPNDGDSFSRPVFDDAIRGQSFFATNLAAVFEPLATRTVSPRVQVGVGRLWDKKLGNWFYGGGLRFRFGSNAIVADVERWNLSFDLRREVLIFRNNGAHELQSFEIIPQSPRPYLIRLGWELRIS